MKVTFVHHGAEFGGVERHVIDLITRLEPSKFELVILCFGRYEFRDACFGKQAGRVKIISGLRRTRFLDYWRGFRETRPDLIVFESGSVGDFPWYGHLAGKLSSARRAIDFEHGMPPGIPKVRVDGLRGLLRRLGGWRTRHGIGRKLAWRVSDKIVTVSNALREALIREYGGPEEKMLTIWNGVDVQYFASNPQKQPDLRASLGIDESESVLLAVARLTPHKRIGMLLEAMEALRKRKNRQEIRCLIAGAGPQEEELRQQCKQMGLSGAVLFLGHQNDVRPCYAAADIFVLPSQSEGFSLSLIEAMASGLAPITTAAGGAVEMISDGRDGWLINSREQLTAAIEYALAHPEERRQAGLRARQKAVEQLSVEACADKIKGLLLAMSAPSAPANLGEAGKRTAGDRGGRAQ